MPQSCAFVQTPQSIKGYRMALKMAPGLVARDSNDVDYQMRVICYKKQCMRFGWGPTWSSWWLSGEMLMGLDQVSKRVVLARNFLPIGTEYQAVRPDGSRFRFVTTLFESIDCDRADAESAAVFNNTMDSLCWLRQ